MLKENGSNLDLTDNCNMNCLHYACKNGHLDVVKFLLNQIVSNGFLNVAAIQDKVYLTPLDFSVARQHGDIAKFLGANGALTMAKIVGIAATRIQALYRSYRIRKSFIEHRDLLLKHERLLHLRRQKRHLAAKSDNDKKRIVHNAASFLGHVIEEKHKTAAIQLKMTTEAAENAAAYSITK